MTLEHMNYSKTQIGGVSSLDHITITKGLQSQFDLFLLASRVNGLSPATLAGYRERVGKFLNFCNQSGLADAHDITTHHVRAYLAYRQEINSPTSVHDYYGTIKRFFNWMVEEGILAQSPMRNIKPPRLPKLTPKPFSRKDIDGVPEGCKRK
jgi:site-specific recombinase XerD